MLFSSPQFLDSSRSAYWQAQTLEAFFAFLDLPASPRVLLDIGCGTGFLAREILKRFPACTVIGLDQNAKAVTQASRPLDTPEGTRAPRGLVADASRIPLRPGSVDVVLSHFFLVDCPNPESVLGEMSRLVRPGGYVCCMEPVYQIDLLNAYLPGVTEAERETLSRAYRKVLLDAPREAGVDRAIVPRLPALIRRAGLADLKVATSAGHALSATLDAESLRVQRELGTQVLQAERAPPARLRQNPLLNRLTDEELDTLVAVQRRIVSHLVDDPAGYQDACYFTCMTFLFLRARKEA